MTKLATIDASALTAKAVIDASAHKADSAALTIKGSATVGSEVTGGQGSDTIIMGAGNDLVGSSAKADTITLGAGNDTYVLMDATHSTIAARDVILDFQANTVAGTDGKLAVDDVAARNGDVIAIDSEIATAGDGAINFATFTTAADAITFLGNSAEAAAGNMVNIAFVSTTGFVYIDLTDNGIADSVIQLTGVTSLTEAAFTFISV
jgi:Ca2+-binding RTX toxin-like protein